MNKGHATKYLQGTIQAKARFPLLPNEKINLTLLHEVLNKEKKFVVTNGNPAYLVVREIMLGEKNSFNVFADGKVVCWHSISPKAWHYYLDYFYYTYVIKCLSDIP